MKVLASAFAALFVAHGASAATIDFDDLVRGSVVSSFNEGGVTGSIAAVGGTNEAIVFDTSNPGTNADGDPDLGAPFTNGVITDFDPKNVLIIGERPDADNGPDTNPDDNGSGGVITFTFDSLVTIMGFDVFDDVRNFVVTADTGATTGAFSIAEDNEFRSFDDLGWAGVKTLTFDFKSASGAIDAIEFEVTPVPVPAALPLLIAGVAGLGMVGRRKRK